MGMRLLEWKAMMVMAALIHNTYYMRVEYGETFHEQAAIFSLAAYSTLTSVINYA